MKMCLYTISLSPHQLPLAKELVKQLGADHFRYIYKRALSTERLNMGWMIENPDWVIYAETDEARRWLKNADVVLSGERDIQLFKARAAAGKKTIYSAERWFKPVPLSIASCFTWRIDGRIRMLFPRYRRMARAIMAMALNDANFMLYPMGVHAAQDFAWLMRRTVKGLDQTPGGKIYDANGPLEKMRLWGYFVEPSVLMQDKTTRAKGALRILWVGRLLAWKRVDVLLRAVGICKSKFPVALTIVGDGPERARLEKLRQKLFSDSPELVTFKSSVPITRVRALMREHDVYVLCSNAQEGWGAVVNEALEEQMIVLGTREAGASGTLLPAERQFSAGDAQGLAKLLEKVSRGELAPQGIGDWAAQKAAYSFIKLIVN